MRSKFISLLIALTVMFAFSVNCFAAGSPIATTIAPETTTISSFNLIITDIKPSNKIVNPGDKVTFDVTIKNIGNQDVPPGQIIEYQLNFSDGTSTILWNDEYDGGLKAGESVTLKTISGSNGVNYWVPKKGVYTITGTVDPNNQLKDESNKNDNQYSIKLKVPTKSGGEPITTTTKPGETTGSGHYYSTPSGGKSYVSPKTGSDIIAILCGLVSAVLISLVAYKKSFSKK